MQELKDFESATMALQRDTTTMAEVRAMFDAIAKEYPIVEKRLAADADIVLDRNFESTLVKLQEGKMDSLSSAEVRSMKHFEKSSEQEYSSAICGLPRRREQSRKILLGVHSPQP